MPEFWSRREFLGSVAGGMAARTVLDIPHPMRPPGPLPPQSRWAAKPVAIASANGLRAVQKAFDMLLQGADTLDESGRAYKDIEDVMARQRDLVDPVVKLRPLGVVKG